MSQTPEPLQRLVFDTQRLMSEHPPVWRDGNKQVVFEAGCPEGCVHGGSLVYTRWAAMPLPNQVDARQACGRVEARQDVYDYAPVLPEGGGLEWHVNFADPCLFFAYHSALLAQDELQVCEHPALGALKEALDAGGFESATGGRGGTPTPVLVRGVERRCRLATGPKQAEGRPNGLYGNAFSAAAPDVVRRATHRIEPPTTTNIIAMAAPACGYGKYDTKTMENVLLTAYTGFRAAMAESDGHAGARRPVAVHTGFWGCGAFGGNRVLMALLQVLAAHLAGLDRLVFHTFDGAGMNALDEASHLLATEFSRDMPMATLALIDRLAAMGFEWGISDGN